MSSLRISSSMNPRMHSRISVSIGSIHDPPVSDSNTAAICESFGYDAFIVQRGEKIAALSAIAALGKNTSLGTDIESRNVLFLPR
jgi:hypothetical protein